MAAKCNSQSHETGINNYVTVTCGLRNRPPEFINPIAHDCNYVANSGSTEQCAAKVESSASKQTGSTSRNSILQNAWI